ncbi:MAG: outer membrane beta-barrel protein [Gammaproteobacteria bacterium]|nr:outer membrane beta-barrel protein [Gammaproteobacteria bacterium]
MIRNIFAFFLILSANSAMASRFYVGGNIGVAALDPTFTVIDNTLNPAVPDIYYAKDYRAVDETVISGSIYVGYKLGKDIALEFGYTEISDSEADRRPLDDSATTEVGVNPATTDLQVNETVGINFTHVALVGLWPIHNQWAFRAKLGLANWDFNYSQAVIDLNDVDFGRTEAYTDSGIDFFYGIGASYGLNEQFEIRADFDFYSFKPAFTNVDAETDMPLFSLGVLYHF